MDYSPQVAILEAELIATRSALADTRTQLVQTWQDRDADIADAGDFSAGMVVGVLAVALVGLMQLMPVSAGFFAGGGVVGFAQALWSRHRLAKRRDRRRLQL